MRKTSAFISFVLLMAFVVSVPVLAEETVERVNKPRYELVPTDNIHTFLLLDTAEGRVWQAHYSISKDAVHGLIPINERSLKPSGALTTPGRFTLVPTQNVWNFLLLDQQDGRVWQTQFSLRDEDGYRFIQRLYNLP